MRRSLRFAVLTLILLGIAAGCATHRVDWAARVGTFTRDEAILELGPPDKSATLTDGTVVADWLQSRGMQTATTYPGSWPAYGRRGWASPGTVILDPAAPDRFLRLTFSPDGKLASWKKIVQ